MRVRTAMLMLLALVLALPAAAQEQRGMIEGEVKDAQGGVLPGASVTAKGPALPSGTTTTTDNGGIYRFPGLPPGRYEVAAELAGFNAVKVPDVELGLGQIKKVALTLTVAGVAESIQVVAESPLIDARQNAAGANIHKEFIEKLPKGRDFLSVVTIAPGANNEPKLAGISIDGSSAAENVYVVDGINTTNIRTGTSAKGVITDFLEEVQVKSSGYNAEFGGSMGGVINVITKSGSNSFRGDVGTYYSGNNLNGDVRPTLRLNPQNDSIAEHITFRDDDDATWEPGGTVGGPLFRDKAWFFAGYMPSLQERERTAPLNDGTTKTTKRNDRTQNFTANVNTQLTQRLRGKFAVNMDNFKRTGLLHELDGTSSPTALFDIDRKQPGATYSGQLDFIATDRFYLAARLGHFRYDTEDIGVPNERRFIFQRSSIGLAGVPASLQRPLGFSNVATNTSVTDDLYTRTGVNIDATYFASFAGQHTFKAGVQLDRYANDVLSGELQPRINLFWNATRAALDGRRVRGDLGYYSWRQFQTTGAVSSNGLGLYVQDSWTLNRVTINAGLRTERERVPAFRTDLGGDKHAIKFNFGDKFAPRLGFAYDVMGDNRWKLYGSYGVYYDIIKLELPRGAFGGDKWIESYYAVDTPNWEAIGDGGRFPGTLIETVDFRHTGNQPGDCAIPSNPNATCIDQNLDPTQQTEFTFGLDHELNARTQIGVRYVHKQVDKTIDDVGVLVPGVGEVFFYANPGFGLAEHTIGPEFPAQPEAKREYDGLEFRLRRRLSDGLQLTASYVASRLWGNFSGLASSDENGRSSPNVNRFFDGIYMSFDEKGNPTYGRLGTDRPHQFKTQVIYDFPFGTTAGWSQYVASGTPISRQVSNFGLPFFYRGRGSEGRTPILSKSDLYLQHELRFRNQRLQVSANILNLFDQDIVTDIWNIELRDNLSIDDPVFFAPGGFDTQALIASQPVRRDARFLRDSGFLGRRQIRLGVKFLF